LRNCSRAFGGSLPLVSIILGSKTVKNKKMYLSNDLVYTTQGINHGQLLRHSKDSKLVKEWNSVYTLQYINVIVDGFMTKVI
jgi:hypothetical protein